ncbi:MAG: hypothetical protein JWM34_4452 [Ilumatobacteraceae bacterium]|nr:hypothetical protein [Ilumatobacteraceae bacterium]
MDDERSSLPDVPMGRRALMSLIGAMVAAATLDACSSDAGPSTTTASVATTGAPSTTAPSTSTTAPTTSTVAPTTTAAPSTTAAAADTTTTATTTTPATTTPATDVATSSTDALRTLSLAYPAPVDTDRLQTLADTYNGTWSGNWAEDSGSSGALGATITIDPASRTVSGQFSYTGPFLQGGAGTPELISLTVPNGDTPENFPVPLGLTGDLVYTYEGGTTAGVTAASLPGNADGLSADLALSGDSATASYSIMSAAGQPVLGAAVVARNRTPDLVDLASIKSQRLNATLFSGRYAADLLPAADASTAVGATIAAMLPNGGNLTFGPGVITSNTDANSADGVLVVQITVYRCADVAKVGTFWPNLVQGLKPHVPDIGDDAVESPFGLYVLAGNLAAVIEVLPLTDAPLPIDQKTAERNIAMVMVPRMRTAP